MGSFTRPVIAALFLISSTAFAQPGPQDPQPAPAPPPTSGYIPTYTDAQAQPPPDDGKPKEPKSGDFDAGGQARFPSGPDAAGKYASFNWVGFDAKAKYYLLKSVTANFSAPLAVKHPDTVMVGTAMESPDMIGGAHLRLDAIVPAAPRLPILGFEYTFGVSLDASYMREGALLLSDKDFPLFTGDFKPGFAGALITKIKLSSVLSFSLVPAWVYQSGTMASHKAVQIPMSLVIKLGSLVKLSADLGVYTGDGYSFGGDSGGRIYAGGALDVKISKIIVHAGAGVASLLTGPEYPTVSDSLYVDLNVKYAK